MVEDQTGETVQALLYRGTPENPAFWRRALRDLPFAAAVIASASGPSGENHVYLNRLDTFLEHVSSCPTILRKFDHTFQLTAMASHLRHESYQLNFLCGSGSNQHNQLLLQSDDNAAELDNNGEETHEFKEIAMCTATQTNNKEGEFDSIQHDPIIGIYAGGGHCGILSQAGRLFLCGWNSAGQLGTSEVEHKQFPNEQNAGKLRFFHVMHELADICVETASFGFAHTLVVEAGTKRLFCFGDNSRGQVNGAIQKDKLPDSSRVPVTPSFLVDEQMSAIGAGVFHSAAVSTSGELFTFGCGRYGQSLSNHLVHDGVSIGRWSPGDGSKLLKVVCGQRHTVVLDDRGRVWTFGDNRYFQLGRQIATSGNDARFDATPKLVDLGSLEYSCVDINCGWSHSVVRVTDSSQRVWVLGWGRNDKGQLGTVSPDNVNNPTRVFSHVSGIQVVSCGSESTSVVDQDDLIFSCGWNEHGNLGTGNTSDCFKATPATGAPVTYTPRFAFNGVSRLTVAAGGAHLIAMRVSTPT